MPTNFPLLTDLSAEDQAELKRIQAIPAGKRTAGEAAFLTARAIYLDSVQNLIEYYDPDGDILRCTGVTVPADGLSGFAKGCLFIKRDAATTVDGTYENVGTTSSCKFQQSGGSGGGGGSGGDEYFIVAASNATTSIKNNANYVCDGVDDQVEIQAAIDALPATGGKVGLSWGTFNITAEIQVFRHAVSVRGAGMDATKVVQGTANTNGFHLGNRQSDGIMRNRVNLEGMTINLPGIAPDSGSGVLADGLGTGSHLKDIICNEGKYGLRLKDLDRVYVENCHPSNQRSAGIRCETGLENTYGKVTFINCSQSVSDTNGACFEFDTAPEQASPNRFDGITIIENLFFGGAVSGSVGLKMTVGATAFTVIGGQFEYGMTQVSLTGETQINFTGVSFIGGVGSVDYLVKFNTNNHFATFTDCRFQQATVGFYNASGFSRLAFYGHNSDQGNIGTKFSGNFSSKEGTDTIFAGDNVLFDGVQDKAYARTYGTLLHLAETSAPSAISGYGTIYTKSSDSKPYFKGDDSVERSLIGNSGVMYTVGSADADYITDGTADEVQINQAITAANTAGGGIVFIKPGTYNCAADVNIKSNVILQGAGSSSILSFTAKYRTKV